MSDDIVENLKEPSQWMRIAFMVALVVALYVAGIVLSILTIAQALFSLLTGSDNSNLRALGKDLATYVHQILAFLTYNSESKPFPFAAYPDSEEEMDIFNDTPQEAPVNVQPMPARKKPASPKAAPSEAKASSGPRKPAAKKIAPAPNPSVETPED